MNSSSARGRFSPGLFGYATQTPARAVVFSCFLAAASSLLSPALLAQTGGEAGIQGTVTDATGAVVPGATVTATNTATGVATVRTTTSDGLYTISPILPGTYTVRVKATGFSEVVQQNLTIDALRLTPLNVTLRIGSQTTEVNVTTAPPQLETTNASLGLTIENAAYANLPLQMNGAQRDPTAFATLAPGAQGGTRLPIIGGTGNYLGQLYLDGLPAETISQQGDNRLVSLSVSVDAVDQLQVVTSTPPAEYSGAGAENFTMKSGTLKYHGQVSDFVRNTSLDAWGFSQKALTVKNALGQNVPAPKPVDHQNELSASFGGHVPGTKRLFFFVAYDRYHNRGQRNPTSFTIPSALERAGDFTELNGNVGNGGLSGTGANNPAFLFDPTTTSCNAAGVCTRQPFQGLKNGVPTNNVIPSNYISPIAKAMQSFLPDPTNTSTLVNNYTAPQPSGYDNHLIDYRVDFDLSSKHRISTIGALGTVNYLNNFSTPYLPLPYTGGDYANIYPKDFAVEDAYTFSNSLVNQIKFGYVRFYQNIRNATQGVDAYSAPTLGITNLPAGQASQEFPGVSFATTAAFGNAQQTWTTNSNSTATQVTTPNNFALVDNLQLVKGRHALTFGMTVQWQQINNANPATFTGILSLPFTPYSTANFGANSGTLTTGTSSSGSGYSYASFLLGAVGGTPSIGLQPVSELGGRYRPIAPYVEDTWKVNNKLTVDAGIRWDYLPPYHEVKDRWSFLNASATNPATGTPGAIQFAGSYGGSGVSCGCRTPVQTYWKNFGPRVGITYQTDEKTVFRIGIGRVFSQGGGVGGRGGAFAGTGQLGFNTTASGPAEVVTGAGSGPSFYLNNSAYFQQIGIANTSLFGPGYTYPSAPSPSVASESLNAGNYVNPTTGKFVTAAGGGVSYADPYFSGRAPDVTFYNAGFERALTNDLTLAINYVGNQSHHLENSTNTGVGGARGYWANQLNPAYLVGLGRVTDSTGRNPLLTAPATAANVAKAQAAMPGINIPQFFQNAAVLNSSATIAQGLVAFPQYSSVTDLWGQNVGNFSYNSLQITLQQRLSHGLTYNFNYTWSRNIGDDGTFRSGFDIPAGAVSGSTQSYKQDRIERGLTTVNIPHAFHAYGVWQMPFGKGRLGGQNMFVRELVGGWQLSAIWTYAAGTPALVTWSGCTTSNYPLQGQCMPNVNPGYGRKSARLNGGFGSSGSGGRTACNLGQGTGCAAVPYFDSNAFQAVPSISPVSAPILLLGNAPRTSAFFLTNPPSQNVDTSLRRSIGLPREMALVLEVDALNTWNHTVFSSPNAVYGSSAFGTITSVSNSPRDFQLAAHFNF